MVNVNRYYHAKLYFTITKKELVKHLKSIIIISQTYEHIENIEAVCVIIVAGGGGAAKLPQSSDRDAGCLFSGN